MRARFSYLSLPETLTEANPSLAVNLTRWTSLCVAALWLDVRVREFSPNLDGCTYTQSKASERRGFVLAGEENASDETGWE
jgi:hypothetical protein